MRAVRRDESPLSPRREAARAKAARRKAALAREAKETRERYARNPTLWKAKVAVARAVKSGLIDKMTTCTCGVSPVEGHHYLGYAKEHWLDVAWLCRSCHMRAHRDPAFTIDPRHTSRGAPTVPQHA